MKRLHSRLQAGLAAAAVALLMAACGGSGYDEPAQPVDPLAAVPDSAMASATGMVSYLTTLSTLLNEVREAVTLAANAAMFTSESTEPEVLR